MWVCECVSVCVLLGYLQLDYHKRVSGIVECTRIATHYLASLHNSSEAIHYTTNLIDFFDFSKPSKPAEPTIGYLLYSLRFFLSIFFFFATQVYVIDFERAGRKFSWTFFFSLPCPFSIQVHVLNTLVYCFVTRGYELVLQCWQKMRFVARKREYFREILLEIELKALKLSNLPDKMTS